MLTEKRASVVFVCLTVEKIIQHSLTAVFFLVDIEGIGAPDIGPWLEISNPVMALLNGALTLLFAGVLLDFRRNVVAALNLAIILAVVDIGAEVLFHGIGYLTVSVVVAAIIIVLSIKLKEVIRTSARYGGGEGSIVDRALDEKHHDRLREVVRRTRLEPALHVRTDKQLVAI